MTNYIRFTEIPDEDSAQIGMNKFRYLKYFKDPSYILSVQKHVRSIMQSKINNTEWSIGQSPEELAQSWEIIAQFLIEWEKIQSGEWTPTQDISTPNSLANTEHISVPPSDDTTNTTHLKGHHSTLLHPAILKLGKLPHKIYTWDLNVLGQYAYATNNYMQEFISLLQNPALTSKDRMQAIKIIKTQINEIADEIEYGTWKIDNVINVIHALSTNLEKAKAAELTEKRKAAEEKKRKMKESMSWDSPTPEASHYFKELEEEMGNTDGVKKMNGSIKIMETETIELPELYKMLDLEHTHTMIGAILAQCRESPSHKNVNNVMESLYPEYSIKTILETAQGLLKSSEDDFVYLIAHELVRAALKHGPAPSGTEFAEDIEDKNLDERDYVNSNYVWFVVHNQIIDDTDAEDINMEKIIYHQGIEDTEQKRYYESSRFSEGMERQVIIKMERMWEYYDPEIYKKLDNLTSEDRLIAILQEIKEYDENICKSILKRLSSFDGNIRLTDVAELFRKTIGSLIGKHSPARIKDNFDQKSDLWVSNFNGGRIEYKSDDQDGTPIKRTSTSSEIKWGDIDNI